MILVRFILSAEIKAKQANSGKWSADDSESV
jgi:hypothetical protein